MTKTCAICLAGGKGTRMGTECPKFLLPINGIPAINYSLIQFDNSCFIDMIVLVCPAQSINEYKLLIDELNLTTEISIVSGGASRQESVYNGLCSIENICDYVLIHDGARPMLDSDTIQNVLNSAIDNKACVAAGKVVNTIKRAHNEKISETLDRSDVYEIYTPQGFEFSLIYKAYQFVIKNNITITDDASAAEAIGCDVYIVDIERKDFKLTTPSDIELVDKLMMIENNIRIGIGYDVHKLVEDRKLILGGIEIPYHLGLLGHSDADVLTHAIMDAILGAAGLSDIGQLFPDTSNEFKGIYSIKLLEKVMEKVYNLGYEISNIDTIITCQMPKIAPHRQSMIDCLAKAMKCSASQVNIKATTSEGLGFEGEGLGISARAIAMLRIKNK